MGDAGASIPTVQPVFGRPMWGTYPGAAALNSVLWVSEISITSGEYTREEENLAFETDLIPFSLLLPLALSGTIASYGLNKRPAAVKGCRKVTKKDMKHNDITPKMQGELFSLSFLFSKLLELTTSSFLLSSTVDAETYDVRADGVLCDVPPAITLPLTKAYALVSLAFSFEKGSEGRERELTPSPTFTSCLSQF